MSIIARSFDFWEAELTWLTQDLKKIVALNDSREETATNVQSGIGEQPTIAVITPKHKDLELIAAALNKHNLPVIYQRSENILEQEHIVWIVNIFRFVSLYSSGRRPEAQSLLPQILSYPFWGLPDMVVADISTQSYKKNKEAWEELKKQTTDTQDSANTENLQYILSDKLAKIPDYSDWLTIMKIYKPSDGLKIDEPEVESIRNIAIFLENFAIQSRALTLGQMLDWLLGVDQHKAYTLSYRTKDLDPTDEVEPDQFE